MMKIAVVYQYIYGNSFGGGEKRLYEIYSRMENVEVDYYAQYNSSVFSREYMSFIPLFKKLLIKRSLRETLLWCFLMFKIPQSRYDIIHLGQMPFFNVLIILLLNKCLIVKRNKPKIIIDWWEYWGESWNKYKFPFNLIGKLTERLILYFGKHFIVISEKTLRDIKMLTKGQLYLIHNGIDLDIIQNAPVNKSSDFIYFGRLEKHKGIDKSILLFKELLKYNPKYKLDILGDGSYRNELQLYVKELEIDKFVNFFGFIEKDIDLYSQVKGAKLMLFFPEQEGGGSISLFESNACKTPVVTSFEENGIDKELFKENTGFYFDDFNVEVIAIKLNEYLNNQSLIDYYNEEAFNLVKDYDWKKISNEYFNLMIKVYDEK